MTGSQVRTPIDMLSTAFPIYAAEVISNVTLFSVHTIAVKYRCALLLLLSYIFQPLQPHTGDQNPTVLRRIE